MSLIHLNCRGSTVLQATGVLLLMSVMLLSSFIYLYLQIGLIQVFFMNCLSRLVLFCSCVTLPSVQSLNLWLFRSSSKVWGLTWNFYASWIDRQCVSLHPWTQNSIKIDLYSLNMSFRAHLVLSLLLSLTRHHLSALSTVSALFLLNILQCFMAD